MTLGIVAVLFSLALLAVLGWRDPKRLRNREHAVAASRATAVLPAGTRRVLGWLVPLPGLILALMGQWWAFLVWLGASCTFGWITAQVLGGSATHKS